MLPLFSSFLISVAALSPVLILESSKRFENFSKVNFYYLIGSSTFSKDSKFDHGGVKILQ